MRFKSVVVLLLCLILSICTFGLIACGGTDDVGNGGSENNGVVDGDGNNETENNGDGDLLEFSGIIFENLTVDYNGEEHTIVATGVPSNATVNYSNPGPFVNANEYTISVSVSAEGYKTFTKSAKLTINKISFPSNIKFEDKSFVANGSERSILVFGDIPEGTQIVYTDNKATEAGTYQATATLKNPNYIEKTLYATLKITSVLNSAKATVDVLLQRPDPWAFMPESFEKDSLACSTSPVNNFNNFVNVNAINTKFMGKQMYVLWEGVKEMDNLLDKVDLVFAAGETIAAAYQNFLNENPENVKEWVGNVAGFDVKILLEGNQSTMLVGNNIFTLELFADSENNINKGRVQLATGAIVNYEATDDYLKFNIALTIKGILTMKQVEFTRDDDVVSGYFFEYTGLKSAALKTSAVISFNEDYAIVMSTKKESEDLLIKGYEEVYSAKTGKLLSVEVLENNKLVDFDTYWVNLSDVTGFTSVKAVPNNKISLNENINDIYVNNSSDIFKPKKNKILMVETSRRFDIEMRTAYYVVKTTNGNNVDYSVVETQIPMLFIQKDNVGDFSEDIVSENKKTFNTTPVLPLENLNVANENFASLKESLDAIKELLTYDELVNQLGTNNSFFN